MYKIYLGNVLLPVAPEQMTLKIKNQNKTMTLINEGEINFLKSAGLTEIEFDVMIPAVQYSFAEYDGWFRNPSFFLNHFESLKVGNTPFRLIVVRSFPDGRSLFNTNMSVSMESYTIKEQAKDGFDLTVSIKLKQYKYFGTKTVTVIENTATVTETPETNTEAETEPTTTKAVVVENRETFNSPAQKNFYVTEEGDTWYNVAKKIWGDGSKYTFLYDANGKKTPLMSPIPKGTILTIPELAQGSTTPRTYPNGSGSSKITYREV